MDYIDDNIIDVLLPHVYTLKELCISNQTIKNYILNDSSCDNIFTDDNYWLTIYLLITLSRPKGVKSLYNLLLKKNIETKKINKFIYYVLKLNIKSEKQLYSWNEIIEWNIDTMENDVTTTNSYKFF